MVAFGARPWVGYVLPDRAPSAGAGHRTKTLHPDTLAYFRTSYDLIVDLESQGADNIWLNYTIPSPTCRIDGTSYIFGNERA